MTRYHAANRFQTRLTASVDESQIYFDVESASGCPEVPFKLTVGTEIVDVIGVVGDTFTVQRGAEGTTPQGHPVGALVQNRWTAGTYEDLWDDVDDLRDNVKTHEENTTDAHDIDKHFDATPEDNVHGLAGQVITESGSNGNGSYRRFGDGTQECWAEVKATYSSGSYVSVTWTYPKPFYSEPEFVGATLISPNLRGSTDLTNLDLGPPFIRNSSETSVMIRMGALGGKSWGENDEIYLKVEAKGYWK